MIPYLNWCQSAECQKVAPQSVSKGHVQENINLPRFSGMVLRVLIRSTRNKHRREGSLKRGRATTSKKYVFSAGAR